MTGVQFPARGKVFHFAITLTVPVRPARLILHHVLQILSPGIKATTAYVSGSRFYRPSVLHSYLLSVATVLDLLLLKFPQM